MKIIYGICGIGNGHTYRQEPLIEHLIAEKHILCIFAYGHSLTFYQKKYIHHKQVKVIQVAVLFIPGNTKKHSGLDFEMAQGIYLQETKTSFDDKKHTTDYWDINLKAMSEAQNWLGKPDLCISDYEPISAQYAYAYNTPVITFDQQSKYLGDNINFPSELNGLSYTDEVMRLNMFFPKVHKRIACSFFDIQHQRDDLLIIAPENNKKFINTPLKHKHYIVYLSSQHGCSQSLPDLVDVLNEYRENKQNEKKFIEEYFHVFLPDCLLSQLNNIECSNKNEIIQLLSAFNNFYNHLPINRLGHIFFYSHGSSAFNDLLKYCHGVISTAGHTLLSECMALNIPVYALPINVYEQQLNAAIIHKYGFGIMENKISFKGLNDFISRVKDFRQNIIADKNKTLRSNKINDGGILLHDDNPLKKIIQEINYFK